MRLRTRCSATAFASHFCQATAGWWSCSHQWWWKSELQMEMQRSPSNAFSTLCLWGLTGWTGPSPLMQWGVTPAKGLPGNVVHKCAMKHRPPNGAWDGQHGEGCHARMGLVPISAMQSKACSMHRISKTGVDQRRWRTDLLWTKIGELGWCGHRENEWIRSKGETRDNLGQIEVGREGGAVV